LVILATRAWLSAVQRGDSAALDSLSAPGEGLQAARHMESRGTAFVTAFASSTARIVVSTVASDSAFVEVRASHEFGGAPLAVVLWRGPTGWRVVQARDLRGECRAYAGE